MIPDLSNLSYDPGTGIMTWIKSVGNKKSGSEVGTKNRQGYRRIQINKNMYLSHRIAFFLMGKDPEGYQVDHINGIRDDNRWSNLRLTDNSGNQCNIKVHREGQHPYVRYSKWHSKWLVWKKPKYYGVFETEHEAIKVAKENNLLRV